MGSKAIITVGIILLYLVINALIIKRLSKKQDTLEEYAVGGRSFGWLLACFSYLGGFYVGATYTGWFANAADIGIFAQYLVIYSVGSLFILYLMARPVWIWGKIFDLETQADIIELRYGNKAFKLVFSFLTFAFWFPWLVIEMKTIGYVVSAATYGALGFNIGMIIACLFVIAYCFYGGARAGAVGNLVQGLTFTIVGVAVVYYLIRQAYGGILPLYRELALLKPELLTLQGDFGGNLWTSSILTGTLGAFCWPGIFNRIYMADSPRAVQKTVFIAPLAAVLIGLLTLTLGLGGSLFKNFPADSQAGAFWMADNFGGPVCLALVGILALAACMSTISAVVNTAAVLIAKDFGGLIKGLSREAILKYAKICTIVVGLISIAIATADLPNLMFVALIMYNCVVQAIVPLLFGQYWKRGNLHGAAIGFVIGVLITIYATMFPESIAWANGWSGGMIGLGVNILIYVVLGLLMPQQEHVDNLFKVVSEYRHETTTSKLI